MTDRTVIHLEFVNPVNGETHYYFGSITALCDAFSSEIGVSRHSLYNAKIEPGKPFKNAVCTIHKGALTPKKGNRKLPGAKQAIQAPVKRININKS